MLIILLLHFLYGLCSSQRVYCWSSPSMWGSCYTELCPKMAMFYYYKFLNKRQWASYIIPGDAEMKSEVNMHLTACPPYFPHFNFSLVPPFGIEATRCATVIFVFNLKGRAECIKKLIVFFTQGAEHFIFWVTRLISEISFSPLQQSLHN